MAFGSQFDINKRLVLLFDRVVAHTQRGKENIFVFSDQILYLFGLLNHLFKRNTRLCTQLDLEFGFVLFGDEVHPYFGKEAQ